MQRVAKVYKNVQVTITTNSGGVGGVKVSKVINGGYIKYEISTDLLGNYLSLDEDQVRGLQGALDNLENAE